MKGLALLLGNPKKGATPTEEPEESGNYASLTDEYASDVYDALKASDKEAFTEAITKLVDACMHHEEE